MASNESALYQQIDILYSNHHGWLRRWLGKKLGDSHQAADLAQDTFMRLLGRDEALQIQEPRAFLTTVAQRVLINHWRRQQLERAYLEALANTPENLSPSPEERAILLETLIEIDQLLDGLPVLVKRTFLLTQLDGLTHVQVAATLNISVTSVKRYLAKAALQCYFGDMTDAPAQRNAA